MMELFYFFNDSILITLKDHKHEKVIAQVPIEEFHFSEHALQQDSISFVFQDNKETKPQQFLFLFTDEISHIKFFGVLNHGVLPSCEGDIDTHLVWSKPNLNEATIPLFDHAGVFINQSCFYFGGMSELQINQSLIQYIPSDGTYQILDSQCPPPRFGHTLTIFKDNAYLFGGKNQSYFLNDFWVFNTKSNEWNIIESVTKPEARAYHSSNIINDFFITFGGENSTGLLNLMSIYQFSTGIWRNSSFINTPSPRTRMISFC